MSGHPFSKGAGMDPLSAGQGVVLGMKKKKKLEHA